MKRSSLGAAHAVRILMPEQLEPGRVAGAPFSSGADVCEWLAAHFGFTGDDYERLYAETEPADPLAAVIAKCEVRLEQHEFEQLVLYVSHEVSDEEGFLLGYDEAAQLPLEELRRRFLADDWGSAWELHDGEDVELHYHHEGAMEALGEVLELLRQLAHAPAVGAEGGAECIRA